MPHSYVICVYTGTAGDAFYCADVGLADAEDDEFIFNGELAELEAITPTVGSDGFLNWDAEPIDPAINREKYRAKEMSDAAALLRKYCWSNPEVREFLNTL